MKTGEKIAILRHKKSYSVTDIAMKLNISSYTVMDWEDGKEVEQEYLYPLCNLLGISVSNFLDDSYVVSDDLVNHHEEKKEEIPSPEKAKRHKKKASPFAGGKNSTSEELYSHYKRIVFSLRGMSAFVVALIAVLFFVFILNNFPAGFYFVFIFLFVYFFFMLVIFFASTTIKKFSYRGHIIVYFQAFVVNRVFVDGERVQVRLAPGPSRQGYGVGLIDIDGETLSLRARHLYTENGEDIAPDK